MQKIYEMAVAVGKYTKNNEEKTTWKNVGSVFEKDGNQFILLDKTFNPAGVPGNEGKSSVLISMFKPKPKDAPQAYQQEISHDLNDEIMF